MPITPPLTDAERNSLTTQRVRFRTVGDMTCTSPVASVADDVNKILAETAQTTVTERGATRLDDQTSEASMEKRKKEGYF
jgi:sulfate adenylyltransferase subunit 2